MLDDPKIAIWLLLFPGAAQGPPNGSGSEASSPTRSKDEGAVKKWRAARPGALYSGILSSAASGIVAAIGSWRGGGAGGGGGGYGDVALIKSNNPHLAGGDKAGKHILKKSPEIDACKNQQTTYCSFPGAFQGRSQASQATGSPAGSKDEGAQVENGGPVAILSPKQTWEPFFVCWHGQTWNRSWGWVLRKPGSRFQHQKVWPVELIEF